MRIGFSELAKKVKIMFLLASETPDFKKMGPDFKQDCEEVLAVAKCFNPTQFADAKAVAENNQ